MSQPRMADLLSFWEEEAWEDLCSTHGLREPVSSNSFTWSNNRAPPDNVMARLDRFYLSAPGAWGGSFGIKTSPFSALSDHCLITLVIRAEVRRTKGYFKLNTSLLKDKATKLVIPAIWDWVSKYYKQPQAAWKKGISLCKDFFSQLGKVRASERNAKLDLIETSLQGFLIHPPVKDEDWETFGNLKKEFDKILEYKREGLAIRAKMRWALDGDLPSKYFFHVNKPPNNKISISEIRDPMTNAVTKDGDKISKILLDYFKAGLKEDPNGFDFQGWEEWSRRHPQNHGVPLVFLQEEVEEKEIWDTISKMPNGKTPGSDGFPIEFYKHFWPTLKIPLLALIRDFTQYSCWKENIHEGIISLIPKTGRKGGGVEDLRPITLLNVPYKIFTKTLARRLKKVLGRIVHKNQTGFIPRRNIFDNFLNVQEGLNLAISSPVPTMGIKLDLEKAYDNVNWQFIFKVLEWLSFPLSFINWIKGCLKGARSAINFYGGTTPSFLMGRSIRQGCPISPMLFSLITQVWCVLIDQALDNGDIKGISIPGENKQLCIQLFADDSMILIEASKKYWENAMTVCRRFCNFMGGKINVAKSEVIWASDEPRPEWALELPWKWVLPGQICRHIGLPLGVRISPSQKWKWMKDKMASKLAKRATRFLTLRGRVLVANFCITGAINFYGIIAAPSLSNLDNNDLSKMIRAFCRKSKLDPPWEILTTDTSKGGLGLVNPTIRVIALRVKLLLNISKGNQFWHHIWRKHLEEAKSSSVASSNWNWWNKLWSQENFKIRRSSLLSPFLESWNLVKNNFVFDLKHPLASKVLAHYPIWGGLLSPQGDCPYQNFRKVASTLSNCNIRVFQDIFPEDREGQQVDASTMGELQKLYVNRVVVFWNNNFQPLTDLDRRGISFREANQVWKVGKCNASSASVKILYNSFTFSLKEPMDWDKRWERNDGALKWERRIRALSRLPLQSNLAIFSWRLLTHSLPLGERMRWNQGGHKLCPGCALEEESHLHLFLGCPRINSLINPILSRVLGGPAPTKRIEDWFFGDTWMSQGNQGRAWRILSLAFLWMIWKAINELIFKAAPLYFTSNSFAHIISDIITGIKAVASKGSKRKAREAGKILEGLRNFRGVKILCPVLS